MLALVLPGEAVVSPDVGPAVPAAGLGRAALEGVPLAGGIVVKGLGLAEQVAEVVEVGLRSGAFLLVHRPPFVHELLRRHGV